MNELVCFTCLTNPDAMPGQDRTRADTLLRGTALCTAHARDVANAEQSAGGSELW